MKVLSYAVIAIGLALLFSGCALTYQKDGKRVLFGLAWVEYRIDDESSKDFTVKINTAKVAIEEIAPVVQQKSLGLYLDVSKNSSGLGLGYRDVVIVVPAVNAESVVEYDTSVPLRSVYTVDKQE